LVFDRPPLGTAVAVPIGLGLGFIAIFVIQLIVARQSHWWPLIPGGILVLVGVAEGFPQAHTLIEKGWPLILVLIGLAILAGQFWPARGAKD
jgi:Na+/H+ antiporter NhaD/arsenite permease-like protein